MTRERLIQLVALREAYRRDFVLYAREQLKIQTKRIGGVEYLDVMKKPLQRMIVRAVYRQLKEQGYVDGNIIKGRQQGSSTVSQALQFWMASLNKNYNSLLIAQDPPTTKSIFEKARFFYENLSPEFKPQIRHSNRAEIVFAASEQKKEVRDRGLGSRMDFAAANNILAATGTTRQGLHASECGKWQEDQIEVLISSLYPCIMQGKGTIRIKESTPFYASRWFRECCDAARNKQVDEFFIFCPWYLEPDYRKLLHPKKDRDLARMVRLSAEEERIVRLAKDGQPKDGVPPFDVTPEQLKWRRWQISQPGFDENLFLQEYPTDYDSCWISFDSRVFNYDRLAAMKSYCRTPLRMIQIEPGPRLFDDPQQRMHADLNYCAIWEEPEPGQEYDIGADCAAGIEGGDWQAAVVWKRRTREQVAEYHWHLDPADYGTKLFWLGLYYNTAQIAVEWTGGYGVAVEGQLKRLNYPNIYLWRHRDQAAAIPTKKTGWQTTTESKAYLVSLFRTFVSHNRVTVRSLILLNEMYDFIQIPYGDRWDYRGGQGNDDLVMAAGIGLVVSDDENQDRAEEGRRESIHHTGLAAISEVAGEMMGQGVQDRYNISNPPRMGGFASEVRGGG